MERPLYHLGVHCRGPPSRVAATTLAREALLTSTSTHDAPFRSTTPHDPRPFTPRRTPTRDHGLPGRHVLLPERPKDGRHAPGPAGSGYAECAHACRGPSVRGIYCLCMAVHVVLTPSQKLNEHCFERCIPKPGAALSKGEESCMSACMEKYMSAWNTVSKQYVGRIQRESAQGGAVQNL